MSLIIPICLYSQLQNDSINPMGYNINCHEFSHPERTAGQLDPSVGRSGTSIPIQFFNTVKALSEAIFESEKQITENISQTKYSLHESQVNLGFGFNQFLKVSEVKFTENVCMHLARKYKRGPKRRLRNLQRKRNLKENLSCSS